MNDDNQMLLIPKPGGVPPGAATAEGPSPDALSHDLLRGAEEIAAFVYGNKSLRRKVYHLAETSRLPVFRLGSVLCARRSVLMAWIADQEQRALRGAATSNSTKD